MAKTTINSELAVTQTATFEAKLSADSFQLNGGGTVDLFQKYEVSVSDVTINSGDTHTVTFTATGVVVGDFTFTQTPDSQEDDLISTAYVSAADEIKIKIHNVNKNTNYTTTTETWAALAISFA